MPPTHQTSARIYINGKYLAQRMTGVQRVAHELVGALDQVLGAAEPNNTLQFTLLHPEGTAAPRLEHISCETLPTPPGGLHVWEQMLLPFAARKGLLVNLTGSAPACATRQVCMLHDAAVFDWPQAYTSSFVLWYRWLFRRLSMRSQFVLTPSAFSRQQLHLHLPALKTRRQGAIRVLPLAADHMDCIDTAASTPWDTQLARKPFVLAVASHNPSKNLRGLLEGYSAWKQREQYQLVLAGGSNAQVFRPDASTPCDADVLTLGAVSDAQLKSLYLRAAAFVQPSWYEGFGLPPLEAMQCGCPVLSSNAASLPEVCGDAAVYFDPSVPGSLAQGLDELLADVPRWQAAGLRHSRTFSWRASATQLCELLTEAQADTSRAVGRPAA